MTLFAVIRIRGKTGLRHDVRQALGLLRLYKRNHCVVIPNTDVYVGMLHKLQDVVTWGDITVDTLKLLLEKRGKIVGNQKLTESYLKDKLKMGLDEFAHHVMTGKKTLNDVPGAKAFFKLSPPRHGFERKGIKTQFSMGGSLGYRKDKINGLIERMV